MKKKSIKDFISIRGAGQNNLKNININIPLNTMTVITGVSGSGKSSLAFDTIYAEAQRRYVSTFSSYARQFFDRTDRPNADSIEGLLPAIAIDQNNSIRTSRSTVGTMTELADHLKLLFSKAADLYCRKCGKKVEEDSPETIFEKLSDIHQRDQSFDELIISFPVRKADGFTREELLNHILSAGYTRIINENNECFDVVQDRLKFTYDNRNRIIEDIETALKYGNGMVSFFSVLNNNSEKVCLKFSNGFHCAECNIQYIRASANHFSFNSPIGACELCRGFGRIIDIDEGLVVPDVNKSLLEGAIKPFESPSFRECRNDLIRFARMRGIPIDVPWKKMHEPEREWVFSGEGEWEDGVWYGVKRFFEWLESRSYKMHIRVFLSRFRAYHTCPLCMGSRLKPDALLWRIGGEEEYNIYAIMQMSIEKAYNFFCSLKLPKQSEEACRILLNEIKSRLRYLVEIGVGYLTLDRQSRTLSAGEIQRINLTTALGTSLVNTLFILDEPSVGLHSRDVNRLNGILHRLRDSGNTVIVVDHDPEVVNEAEYIIEMGPGAGEKGGNVVFAGNKEDFFSATNSLTAHYLNGKRNIIRDDKKINLTNNKYIKIIGAAEHNLKNIDVEFPLNCIVAVSGVSGSGKSTLVRDILYRGICRLKGKSIDAPGAHSAIIGYEAVSEIIIADQAAIRKTIRSNVVSYIGAFDNIRKLFGSAILSKERGYSASTFSFNGGNGRCPVCKGAGFEIVEMQFLNDISLTCSECRGKRYKKEVLEVTITEPYDPVPKSIDDVLSMSVEEACNFFSKHAGIVDKLNILREIGLGYLQLGRLLPSLSRGEAQRLKLAYHLTFKNSDKKDSKLFILDEPTTGLHFEEISKLFKALDRLVDAGHSIIVIEHNLDVLICADWIIDLGPEGGDRGGNIVFAGTPQDCMKCKESHTGRALAEYVSRKGKSIKHKKETIFGLYESNDTKKEIIISGAREHNLKEINVSLPREKLVVITGVSGSGKSTLAFDLIFSEGQRRYLQSINAYARQFVQPPPHADFDSISGIPPTVAVEQRTSRGGLKSTVATITEIYHYLRLLFIKTGIQYCPECNIPIGIQTVDKITENLINKFPNTSITLFAPLVVNKKGIYRELAQWALSHGYNTLRLDGVLTNTDKWPELDRYRDHSIELPVEKIIISRKEVNSLRKAIEKSFVLGKGIVHVDIKRTDGIIEKAAYSTIRACPVCGTGFDEPDPRLLSFNSPHGWCKKCYGTGLMMSGFDEQHNGEEVWWNKCRMEETDICPECNGKRLNKVALSVKIGSFNIADITSFTIQEAYKYFKKIRFTGREAELAKEIVPEILSRLDFLIAVGIGYLSLDRSAPTLSGGEAQRVRLASQLGANLRGVCYVLDEPTIGLHSRDNQRLLGTLRRLQEKGNTVIVVEHDETTIRNADWVIDMGPGGGICGGHIIAQGTLSDICINHQSITGKYLQRMKKSSTFSPRPVDPSRRLMIHKANLHNLAEIDVSIPLGLLVAVTGVSGSGKSTLIRDVLYRNIAEILSQKRKKDKYQFKGCLNITGWEIITGILEVDQNPIGKNPRSCPATYIGFWDKIRRIFAETKESIIRGYNQSRFSFNIDGGRCAACEGQGVRKIEMNFLPDVIVFCETCNGKRFNSETLAVTYKGKNIADMLSMSVDEAAIFFSSHTSIHRPLMLLKEAGLGYLTLGQPSLTLSGGEAQRIKLITELNKINSADITAKLQDKRSNKHTLFILDEPTVGLHMADIEKLMIILNRLVDAGNSVIIIEHNLDVISQVDWMIDLGPEGGNKGGMIVAEGRPREIAEKWRYSFTGKYLRRYREGKL